ARECNCGAGCGEGLGDFAADTAAGAGDEGALASKIKHLGPPEDRSIQVLEKLIQMLKRSVGPRRRRCPPAFRRTGSTHRAKSAWRDRKGPCRPPVRPDWSRHRYRRT